MNIKDISGYVLAGLGLIGILVSAEKTKEKIIFLKAIPSDYILIGGIILAAVGVVLMIITGKSSGKQKNKEVPIYKGKEIVGYRRD